MNTILEYNAKVDSKKRITLHNTNYEYYHVETFDDGTIKLSPRVLINPQATNNQILQVVETLRQNAIKNGTADMPLSEINKEIYGYD